MTGQFRPVVLCVALTVVLPYLDLARVPIPTRSTLVDEQNDLEKLEESMQCVVSLESHVVCCLRTPCPEDDGEEGEKDGNMGGGLDLVLLFQCQSTSIRGMRKGDVQS
jgi:hypothetical protein